MLTLIGSALGFLTSFAPRVMDHLQDKQDKAHELRMIEATTKAQAKLEEVRIQGVQMDAQIREIESLQKSQTSMVQKAGGFISKLSASVRPVVTYLFVLEFLIINTSIAYLTLTTDGFTIEALKSILNDDFMALLSTMLSFWFGNRMFGKRKC